MRPITFALALGAALGSSCRSSSGQHDAGAGSEPLPTDAPALDAPPGAPCTVTHGTMVRARSIGTVSGGATLATSPPGDGRLFVLEQEGRIRIFDHEVLRDAPFLDISGNSNGPVVAGGELGLLGLAFDPSYATNRYFYVDFTEANPDTADTANPYADTIVRFQASATDPNVADPASATVILTIPDFAANHNGGMIEFGADGYLYISTGDGGGAGDPHRNGQNPHALLAKILRIDVAHPAGSLPYSIPADNPFAAGGGAPEVFITGVRNAWRWSFDRGTGDLWIADVGQGQIEELDVLLAGQQAGKNLGWSVYEGDVCCQLQTDKCAQSGAQQACDPTGLVFPQVKKSHAGDGWNAIIGGQVYRGACYPDLVGTYLYTDNVHAGLSAAHLGSDGSVTTADLTGTFPASPSSIHADSRGELYETTTSGEVFHLEVAP